MAGSLPEPVFIAGPTAVGKSAVALELARQIQGEIISVDSMQVYRGLDIGTAKPSIQERREVPHHLIDIVDLNQSFDAAQFAAMARVAMAEIQSRGHRPIFCGGTGLYFNAFIHGLGDAPPSDPALRAALEAVPLENLLEELRQSDPVTYERIDRQNPRRVIRALEVIRQTGRSYSEQRAAWPASSKIRAFGLARQTDDLRKRIDRRVDQMFADGLAEETKQLLSQGLANNRTAMQALGYRQVMEHLHSDCSLPEAMERVKIKTRQFAKRQMTWFRRQMNLEWIEVDSIQTPAQVAGKMLDGL
jgi:tRNA dimethylallyltransferase